LNGFIMASIFFIPIFSLRGCEY